jgi:hypothetical protein
MLTVIGNLVVCCAIAKAAHIVVVQFQLADELVFQL